MNLHKWTIQQLKGWTNEQLENKWTTFRPRWHSKTFFNGTIIKTPNNSFLLHLQFFFVSFFEQSLCYTEKLNQFPPCSLISAFCSPPVRKSCGGLFFFPPHSLFDFDEVLIFCLILHTLPNRRNAQSLVGVSPPAERAHNWQFCINLNNIFVH